jgi:hypothetical protein
VALVRRQTQVTAAEVKAWVDRKFQDPKWVAKIKTRRDGAYAQMRAMGLLNSAK